MAPRYSHYLLPVRGGRFPGRVLCLSVSGELSGATGTVGVERSTLAGWSSVLLERHDGAYAWKWDLSGRHEETFWAGLRMLLAQRGTTWVVSPHACRAWALLGLWERLEAGSVTLRRPAVPLAGGTVSALRARREGTLLAEDPHRCYGYGYPGRRERWSGATPGTGGQVAATGRALPRLWRGGWLGWSSRGAPPSSLFPWAAYK
jgi:hypothetical protein